MGVLGLWKLLEDGGKPVPLDTLENKILAVDISIWLHQTIKGFQDGRGNALPNAHLTGLFIRLCKLLHYRIKPVFVFDGGVPALKRQTIEKRAQMKSKTLTEANRIEQLLLEGLARESVVQQMLGNKVKDIISPTKNRGRTRQEEKDEMFKLPETSEVKEVEEIPDEEEDESNHDEIKDFYLSHIQDIDVSNPHFKTIPADIRHTILYDMKEARKQSSWGRLHEMPSQSNDFSSFQMKRLLKRRQVQVSLEQAESEMGGKSLTLNELENLMSEEGIIDVEKKAKPLASDENTHFLYVKGVKAAMDEAKNQPTEPQVEVVNDEDMDLQMAIAMSLEDDPANLTQMDVKSTKEIRLNTPQRETLKKGAKDSAKAYMQEYGVLTTEEISDLFTKKDEGGEEEPSKAKKKLEIIEEIQSSQETVLYEVNEESKEEKEEIASISSTNDSDFVDVPEDDLNTSQIFTTQVEYPLPEANAENEVRVEDVKKLEVVIDTTKFKAEDDLFADIFEKKEEIIEVEDSPEKLSKKLSPKHVKKPVLESIEGIEPILDSESEAEPEIEHQEAIQDSPKKLQQKAATKAPKDILEELKAQKEALLSLNNSNLSDLVEIPSSPEPSNDFKILERNASKRSLESIPEEKEEEPKTPVKKVIIDATKLLKSPPSTGKTPEKAKKGETPTPEKKMDEAILSVPGTSSENLEQIKEKLRLEAEKLKSGQDLEELAALASSVATENRLLVQEMNKKDRHGLSITDRMTTECQVLLKLFGIPFIVAPMEAEAQCGFLNQVGLVDGIITDDSDVWLFGGKTVYKNFFDKEKVVMEFRYETIERLYHIDRSKMIQLALLVGSDYTSGIPGVGTVTALEILAAFPDTQGSDKLMTILSCLRKFRDWVANGKNSYSKETTTLKSKLKSLKEIGEGFPNRAVVEAYLHPSVDLSEENFTWGEPDLENIKEFAKRYMNWTEKRTDEYLVPLMKRLGDRQIQQSIKSFFKIKAVESHKDLGVSKRVKTAIARLGGEEIAEDEPKKRKKLKKLEENEEEETQKSTKRKKNASEKPQNEAEKVKKPRKTNKKEKKVEENGESEPTKTRQMRKRKTQKDENVEGDDEVEVHVKVPRIPNTKAPIPQRVVDQRKAEEDKQKAIEIFKAKKATAKK